MESSAEIPCKCSIGKAGKGCGTFVIERDALGSVDRRSIKRRRTKGKCI